VINKDKFGNPIYKKVFERLCIKGEILKLNGYFESIKKPNLFCKKLPEGWLYADMRGNKMVPIWEDTSPLLSWKFDENVPMWKRRRTLAEEISTLSNDGCDCRLPHDLVGTKEFEATVMIEDSAARIVWCGGDGYCLHCKKDIRSDDLFCSKECEHENKASHKVTCLVCKELCEKEQIVQHHTCYDPEITITICRKCHNIIHKSNELPQLKPYDRPILKKA
jgi:hypothetical protein